MPKGDALQSLLSPPPPPRPGQLAKQDPSRKSVVYCYSEEVDQEIPLSELETPSTTFDVTRGEIAHTVDSPLQPSELILTADRICSWWLVASPIFTHFSISSLESDWQSALVAALPSFAQRSANRQLRSFINPSFVDHLADSR
ncbi:hypothetical protein TcWFU_006957 [Taenia crassiceps]|uniref:Uncharacterized protein n=1 Tax=Taenia crassiceps TaxID=6207 RepID=A0ABR4Q487_9CEST